MARGFNLTSEGPAGPGGDLDIHTLCVDSPTIVRDAWVCALRTRKGSWYYDPATGLDPETVNLSAQTADISATLESEVYTMLSITEGATVTAITVVYEGGRNWRVLVVGTTDNKLVTLDTLLTL